MQTRQQSDSLPATSRSYTIATGLPKPADRRMLNLLSASRIPCFVASGHPQAYNNQLEILQLLHTLLVRYALDRKAVARSSGK